MIIIVLKFIYSNPGISWISTLQGNRKNYTTLEQEAASIELYNRLISLQMI